MSIEAVDPVTGEVVELTEAEGVHRVEDVEAIDADGPTPAAFLRDLKVGAR